MLRHATHEQVGKWQTKTDLQTDLVYRTREKMGQKVEDVGEQKLKDHEPASSRRRNGYILLSIPHHYTCISY